MKSVGTPEVTFALFAAAVAVILLDLDSFLSAEAATVTLLAASIGAALTTIIWPRKPGPWAGAGIVFLAYPIIWTAFLIAALAEHGSGGSILLWVVHYAINGVTSLVLTGWLTIPAGALLGYLLNRRSSRTDGKPTASPSGPSQTHGYTSGDPSPASRR